MQFINFTNFSTEDFTHKHNGNPITIKAGQTVPLEDVIAHLFAKHLTDREMDRAGIPTDNQHQRGIIGSKCFENVKPVEIEEVVEAQVAQVNESAEVEEEAEDNSRGSAEPEAVKPAKKTGVKKTPAKETKKVEAEEEFADLKED